MTSPLRAWQLALSTPQVCAAAVSNISRAVAPALRSGSQDVTTLSLPPVSRLPNLGWSHACSTRMLDQSASSSSATSMGRAVLTPWPISDLLTHTVMAPVPSILKKALGANDWLDSATVSATPEEGAR